MEEKYYNCFTVKTSVSNRFSSIATRIIMHLKEMHLSDKGIKAINGEQESLEPLRAHLRDDIDYWTKRIEEINERCDLNGLLKGQSRYKVTLSDVTHVKEEKERKLTISNALYCELKELCPKYGISLHSILQFAWHKVLSVYGNGNQTVVAMTELEKNMESSFQSLNNALPIIVNHEEQQKQSTIEAIKDIEAKVNRALNNCSYVELDQFKHGLFDSLFVFVDDEISDNEEKEEKAKSIEGKSQLQFPLAAIVSETQKTGLTVTICYAGELFEDETIDRLLSVVNVLLAQIASNATQPIAELEFLSLKQKQQLDEWNNTDADFPSTKRLHHLFEEAAERSPDKVAVVYEDVKLTYQELNERSNQLAHYLHSPIDVKPEEFIALFLDKSELMIITVLGVWKSGAAYVPIDPTYPNDRARFILEDTKAKFIITNQCHASRLEKYISSNNQLHIIEIEPLLASLKDNPSVPVDNLRLDVTSSQLAYVTYTSGTTGVPKGVFKEHKGVVNSITDLAVKYNIRERPEAIVLFSAYVFEPFVRQTLMALLNSQLLVIVNDDEKLDPHKFPHFLKRHGITYLNGTASVLQEYDYSDCATLSKLLLVGEEFTELRYKKLRQNFKHRIISEYGFTESALVTAMKVFEPDAKRTDRSIGRPLRNVKCYILSSNLKKMPIGAIGELYIGGIGVSRGYLNRPELTKERFLPNPFQTEAEKRQGINGQIYKTGDLARWLPNGEVEYLGRNDFQVKLRGIRIEPGEIESVLSLYPGIKKCVVVAKDLKRGDEATSSKHLVGYFVSENGEIAEADLIAYLETKLPRYMIPTRLIQMKRILVTINGKVDLRALPDIDASMVNAVKVGMRNDLDSKLCKIWSDTLGIPLENIGINDDFFRLGGHSITCIQLIGRIRQYLCLDVTVENIFTLKTIEKLSDHLIKEKQRADKAQKHLNPVDHQVFLLPTCELGKEIDGFYLANSLQQGFMYHYLKQSDFDDAYIMQSLYQYKTKIYLDHLKNAWEYAQKKYSCLRMRFVWEKEFLQIVDKTQPLDWRFVDLTGEQDTQAQELAIKQLQERDRKEQYHLETGKLFRIYLIKQNEELFSFLFSCHHIILDGWSFPILYEYVHQTYLQLIQGEQVMLDQDGTYSEAQKYLQAHRRDNIDYWTKQIDQIVERCNLNGLLNEHSRYKMPLSSYDHVKDQKEKSLKIGDAWNLKLKEICSTNGITLHSILQFVWHKVLHVYGNGGQTVVGTTVSGRNLPIDNIESSVGLFINTLPLIVNHDEQKRKNIVDAIKDIQAKVNAMNSRSNVELGQLQKGELKHGLFDSLFVLENYPNLDKTQAQLHKELLCFEAKYDVEKLDYPLAVIACETEKNGITFTICYAGELFNESTIDELLNVVDKLLRQIVDNLEQPVVNLEFLVPNQLQQLDEWNKTDTQFPCTQTLHQIFEEEAERSLDKVAVVYEDVKLTYQQLNERSNQLAYYLQSLIDINPDELIALFMEKSELMLLSIFGVWKSGAAYVPIDPSYPDDRIQFILEDTKAKVIIANQHYASRLRELSNGALHVLEIESAIQLTSNFKICNPQPISSSTDLAYVIYTSGTTGKPKGVMIEHRGVVNLQVSLASIFAIKERDDEAILSFSNYVFDHFVEQMTDALLNGQTLVVLNDEMRTDKQRLYKYLNDNKVTYLSGTPSVLSIYEYDKLKHINRIDAVGEDFSELVFNKMRSTFGGLIINGYGPTEISITSHKRLYPFDERRTNKSIGNQVANTKCYVLNNDMKRIPIGAVGELYIGGVGVARGYLNRQELTAQQFLANPFQTENEKKEGKNAVIYKTGDLVRWLPNGEVEYLGRNDFQVKVRGLRIELGEIETVILSYPGIIQSIVIARDHQMKDNKGLSAPQKYIIGYYVSRRALLERDIKKFIQSKLPEYMIPNRLVQIEKIPVTISGKLDTKLLPQIEFSKSNNEYVAPCNEVEIKLCNIWSDLLGIPAEHIGINDDFFSLGGDSLMVTSLSFMITNSFGRSVTVATVFKHKTIEALSHYIVNEADDSKSIEHLDSQDAVVSLSQERLLFIIEFENGTDAYNIVMNMELPNQVNRDVLKQSLLSLLLRHEILRTLLPGQKNGGIHLQHVLNEQEAQAMFHINEIVVSNAEELDDELIKASKYIFSLGEELPIKVSFYKNTANKDSFYMNIVIHHICFDGWSWGIFQRDLKAFYDFHMKGSSSLNLPLLITQYKEFATWQRRHLTGTRLKTLLNYWLQKLDGFEPLNLMPDFPRPSHFDYSGKDIYFELDRETTNGLKALAKDLKVSLYSVLVSAYCLMLSNYTNQRDIVIGTPVANRNRSELENMIGFFVNMLVLRVDIDPKAAVANYIQAVSEEVIKSQIHQEMPFEKLVKGLRIENDFSRHPIIQVIFNLNLSEAKANSMLSDESSHLEMSNYYTNNNDYTTIKYDMTATMNKCDTGMMGNFNFAVSLFHEDTVNSFLQTYKHILKQFSQLSACNECKIANITSLDEVGYCKLLAGNGMTVQQFHNADKTLHHLFEEVAEKSLDKVAVVYEDIELTYQQLNERSNQLAHYLQSLIDIKPDELIALFVDKSELMIVSILAAWKAGAAYVPIDPTYPSDRIEFILEDTKAKIVIANQIYGARLKEIAKGTLVVEIDDPFTIGTLSQQSTSNCESDARENNLAYVIYTSGTTGKPKGVMIEHRTVVNLRENLVNRYFDGNLDQEQAVLFLSNYVFDFSVEQLILSILNSSKLIMIANNFSIDDQFYNYVNVNKLTYLSGTPTFLQQIDLSKLTHLQTLTVAGEAFNKSHYEKIRKEFSGTVINAYGTTETTVYNMVSWFQNDTKFKNSLGELLSNMNKFVLNDNLQLSPRGAIGELYLAGNCMARGYLNQPELTSQQFLANPFQTEEGKRDRQFSYIYKTGDLVRYLPDGELEYLGRNDFQVKISGLRIELREIEAVLASYPGVEQCAVLAKYDENARHSKQAKYLIGYFVSNDMGLLESEIKAFLQKKLPNYMVPARLVRIEGKLPVTINGKLDTRSLPQVDFSTEKEHYAAPRNDLESRVCRIWSALLGINNIGIDDDFFKLGGDSILSLQLVSQIQSELNLKVTVKDIFVFKSIRSLFDNVLANEDQATHLKEVCNAEQGILSGEVPMLPIQKWFFAKELICHSHWNQSFAIKTPQLNLEKLRAALSMLRDHHDAFQLRFKKTEDKYVQFYESNRDEVVLNTLDIQSLGREDQLNDVLTKWQSGFNIENGPTFCVGYLHGYDDGSARVWFAMHHLIVDSVSWRIICQDLQTLYNGGSLGQKGSSYRQWAQAVQDYSYSEAEKLYWNHLVEDASSFNQKLISTNKVSHHTSFTLTADETKSLLRNCHQAYDTQINDLLLSALGYALQETTRSHINYVTLEGHGREDIDSTLNISSTVGWFTTLYPVVLEIGDDLGSSISNIKECLRQVPNKGIGYGTIFGYLEKALPQVSFNYLGQFDQGTSATGFWSLVDVTGEYGLDRSDSSEEANDNVIDVTGLCFNGHMCFNIASHLSLEETERFKAVFKMKLEQIIEHTLSFVHPQKDIKESTSTGMAVDHFEPYFEFHNPPGGAVLFILPPGEGGAESYFNNIVQQLTQFKLVLFNNYYLHLKSPQTSFEELAKFYISYVKQIQPKGPYNFLGWSFGGLLSLEISRQLVGAGEKIDNLIFIDSYFNVKKACSDINQADEVDIIDRINYFYSPKEADMKQLVSNTRNIVLFKAAKLNDTYRSDNQLLLFDYYMKSDFNNLDTLMDPQSIQLFHLADDTHASWVKNEHQVTSMCNSISSKLKQAVGK